MCAIAVKAYWTAYRNIKQQNELLLKTVFNSKSNYLHHRDCIRGAFGVGTQRLARLWKVVQQQRSRPFVKIAKKKVSHYSDVVLPRGCVESQCQHGCANNLKKPLLPAAIGQNITVMLGKDLTMQKVKLFSSLWIVTLPQMNARRVVMVQHTTSIQSSPSFEPPTEMIHSMSTSAITVCCTNSTAHLKKRVRGRFLSVHFICGTNSTTHM